VDVDPWPALHDATAAVRWVSPSHAVVIDVAAPRQGGSPVRLAQIGGQLPSLPSEHGAHDEEDTGQGPAGHQVDQQRRLLTAERTEMRGDMF
jgi:hypothetical protein